MVNVRRTLFRVNLDLMVSRAHRSLQSIPDAKAPDELRVFLIGNSSALFSIIPHLVEERIAAVMAGKRPASSATPKSIVGKMCTFDVASRRSGAPEGSRVASSQASRA